MSELSPRLRLPLLSVGQAQKEMTHNEALALIDILLHPVVEAVAPSAIPASPLVGQCWVVGTSAIGAWAGKDGHVAGWTAGGWRFVAPVQGMALWSLADSVIARRTANAWELGRSAALSYHVAGLQVVGAQRPAISNPMGGINTDTEARATIGAVLSALRLHGLIAI
jgi:hypothetical protein